MTSDALSTHAVSTQEVFNQTPPFANLNLAALDAPLRGAVARFGTETGSQALSAFGAALGREEHLELGRIANENPPKLRSFARC